MHEDTIPATMVGAALILLVWFIWEIIKTKPEVIINALVFGLGAYLIGIIIIKIFKKIGERD